MHNHRIKLLDKLKQLVKSKTICEPYTMVKLTLFWCNLF